MRAHIAELTEQIQKLSNFHSHSRNQYQSKSFQQKTFDTCWYHYNFKNQARAYTPPCKFNKRFDGTLSSTTQMLSLSIVPKSHFLRLISNDTVTCSISLNNNIFRFPFIIANIPNAIISANF